MENQREGKMERANSSSKRNFINVGTWHKMGIAKLGRSNLKKMDKEAKHSTTHSYPLQKVAHSYTCMTKDSSCIHHVWSNLMGCYLQWPIMHHMDLFPFTRQSYNDTRFQTSESATPNQNPRSPAPRDICKGSRCRNKYVIFFSLAFTKLKRHIWNIIRALQW